MSSYISIGRGKFMVDELSRKAVMVQPDGSRVPLDWRRTAYLTHDSFSIPIGGDSRSVVMVAGGDIVSAMEACAISGVRVNISDDAYGLFHAIGQHAQAAAALDSPKEGEDE